MKNKLIGLCAVFIMTFAQSVFAGGPEKGELTVKGRGAISTIDIKYNITQLMGEPLVTAVYRWHSITRKQIDGDTKLWLKVQALTGENSAYIEVSPTVPDEGEWAFDTTGSPNWDKVLAKSTKDGEVTEWYPANIAKRFWKEGFTVVDAKLSIIFN